MKSLNCMSLIICLTLFSTVYSEQLSSFIVSDNHIANQSPRSLAKIISEQQPQLLQKAVLHYLLKQIERMQQSQDQMSIKKFLGEWFRPDNIATIYEVIQKHMQQKLYEKLEMQELTDSFKRQIQQNPQEYFLTFDMYDLLIDQ